MTVDNKGPFQKPACAVRPADTIPKVRLAWIIGMAHWIMEEQPGGLAVQTVGFLTVPRMTERQHGIGDMSLPCGHVVHDDLV